MIFDAHLHQPYGNATSAISARRLTRAATNCRRRWGPSIHRFTYAYDHCLLDLTVRFKVNSVRKRIDRPYRPALRDASTAAEADKIMGETIYGKGFEPPPLKPIELTSVTGGTYTVPGGWEYDCEEHDLPHSFSIASSLHNFRDLSTLHNAITEASGFRGPTHPHRKLALD